MNRACLLLCVLLPLLSAHHTQSQTFRYWVDQFGATASLLSGAVVGGDAGPSAIYYNPAQIANITDPVLTLNSDVVGMEFYNAQNVLGNEIDLSAVNFRVFPSFFSLQFNHKKNDRLKFEFAVLTREEFRFDINQGRQSIRELEEVGESKYDASVDNFLDFKNVWIGFGGAYRINDKWRVGGSLFLTIKANSFKSIIDANLFPLSDSTLQANGFERYFFANATSNDRTRYTDIGILGKFGVQYKGSRWNLGMNLTTPSFQLFGFGDITRKISFSNIPDDDGGLMPDFILTDQQRKVNARLKDPLSLSFGARYKIFNNRRTALYLTAELFQQIEPYRIFDTEVNDDIGPQEILDTLDTENFLNVFNGHKRLINVALGFGSQISEKTYLLTGFRTDFNYRKGFQEEILNSGFEPTSLDFNVYHFSAGGLFTLQKNAVFAGLQLSMGGADNLRQIANIDDDEEGGPPLIGEPTRTAKINYFAFALFFGFNIDVGQKD